MESKRQSQEEGDQILAHQSKRRRREEDSQQSETLRGISGFRFLLSIRNDLGHHLADLVKKLVGEELDRQLFASGPISNETREAKLLQLVFKNELPCTIFTSSKIKAKDNTPLEVVLYDIKSKSIVADDDDPLSSIRIEICVLNGEFGSNGSEDWSADEFNAKIEPPRNNKGSLLKGDTVIALKNGVGYITNVEFTDNSSWTRTRQFRLGAKVVPSNFKDANIKEGRSKAFIVNDCRGNQKHFPPSLDDEIWRLKHISKNGKLYKQLSSKGINTVEDLLQEHETNPSSLQEKFGNISEKKREAIIKHAKEAKHAETCVAEATFNNGQNYHLEKNTLNSNNKQSCTNLKDQMPIETIITHELVKTLTQATQYGDLDQHLQQLDFPIALQGEEIYRQMVPLNWPAWEQFVPGTSSYIEDGNICPVDQIVSCCTPPDINSFFPCDDDGPESSNHSSFPTSDLCISNKGKSKIV